MIRIVVTFLVAFQSLVPPGMCLCQFVPAVAAPHQAREVPPAFPTSVAAHIEDASCWCAACQKAAPAAAPRSHEQTGPECETPHERHSLPTPTSPYSGCPVVCAGPAARVAILCAPEQAPLDTAVHFVVSTVEAVSTRADRPTLLVKPAAPPLFVRHCAFLI